MALAAQSAGNRIPDRRVFRACGRECRAQVGAQRDRHRRSASGRARRRCRHLVLNRGSPHNDIMRRPEDLVEFKRHLRRLFDQIKAVHGENAFINVFPALPNSASVEVGRVRMPKANLPLHIYDQNRSVGGFIPTLKITS